MTNGQFSDLSKIVSWCDKNLVVLYKQGKSLIDIALQCIHTLFPNGKTTVSDCSIREYMRIYLSI